MCPFRTDGLISKTLQLQLFSSTEAQSISASFLGEKKQVSIVESLDGEQERRTAARKKREKFKRQDTPLHPHCVR